MPTLVSAQDDITINVNAFGTTDDVTVGTLTCTKLKCDHIEAASNAAAYVKYDSDYWRAHRGTGSEARLVGEDDGGATVVLSDGRLKHNRTPIEHAVQTILQLLGFIAIYSQTDRLDP